MQFFHIVISIPFYTFVVVNSLSFRGKFYQQHFTNYHKMLEMATLTLTENVQMLPDPEEKN